MLATQPEAKHCLHLIFVGDIVPDAVVEVAGDISNGAGHDAQQPVEVMRAPIVEVAAADRLARSPPIRIRFAEAAAPHFDRKDFTQQLIRPLPK